jgi:cyclohexa-1,5-dienecarbonyl-CoA hydratase
MTTAAQAQPLQVWRDRSDQLLRLRLSRPKANVVDAAMIAALDKALAEAANDPHLRAALIDADGPHFSFGASIAEHLPGQFAAMLKAIHGLLLRMLAYPVPILVAVRGQCLGGGLEVVMSGHLIFAAPDAKLGQPEIQVGVFPPAASCLLPERVGMAQAEDLIYSGRSISGEEAFRIGLVNAVAADPEAAALAYYDEHLAKKSAVVLRLAVRAVRAEMVERVRTKLARLEALYEKELMATRDAVEGLQSFLEKRSPAWQDR